MDLKKVSVQTNIYYNNNWNYKKTKKNYSIKPSVMVSATPYNFFTSLHQWRRKNAKDVFSQQKIITASLTLERFTKNEYNIILSYIYQLLCFIILSYIYQLLYYMELYLSTLNVNWILYLFIWVYILLYYKV